VQPLDPDLAVKIRAATQAHPIRVLAARSDPREFNRLVLKEERTNKPIKQAPFHDEWHDILDEHREVCIWGHLESGKSSQITIGRTLYEIGKNPNIHILLVSKTLKNARKFLRPIAQYIGSDPREPNSGSRDLREVFPHLRRHPDRSMSWNTEALTVSRDHISKDPTIQICGAHGNIMGARLDGIILDDALDPDSTRSPEERNKFIDWLRGYALGRLSADGFVWFLGNAMHPEDAMHVLEKEGFYGKRYPVYSANGTIVWPQVWSKHRIEVQKRILGPEEFSRQMLCLARDDSSARFKREYIDRCLANGRGYRLVRGAKKLPDGFGIFIGVDVGIDDRGTADLTVFFCVLLHPNRKRQILWIESGRWTGPEILIRLDDIATRFPESIFIVENVQAQQYLVQFGWQHTRATIIPFKTGRNKADPTFGLESLAVEMANGMWAFPNSSKGSDGAPVVSKEIDALISGLLYYERGKHTADHLMAMWFAREGLRRYEIAERSDPEESIEAALTEARNSVHVFGPGETDDEEVERRSRRKHLLDAAASADNQDEVEEPAPSLPEMSEQEAREREQRARRAHLVDDL
jgi:hypothetical protein